MVRDRSRGRDFVLLTLAGASAFWVANLLISLTPVAAAYRAATGTTYVPMLVESLIGGIVIAAGVAVAVLWRQRRPPQQAPLRAALRPAGLAIVLATVVVEVPAKLLGPNPSGWGTLAVAAAINVIRIAALGIAIGVVSSRLHNRAAPRRPIPAAASHPWERT